jgi:hypothetical protein
MAPAVVLADSQSSLGSAVTAECNAQNVSKAIDCACTGRAAPETRSLLIARHQSQLPALKASIAKYPVEKQPEMLEYYERVSRYEPSVGAILLEITQSGKCKSPEPVRQRVLAECGRAGRPAHVCRCEADYVAQTYANSPATMNAGFMIVTSSKATLQCANTPEPAGAKAVMPVSASAPASPPTTQKPAAASPSPYSPSNWARWYCAEKPGEVDEECQRNFDSMSPERQQRAGWAKSSRTKVRPPKNE